MSRPFLPYQATISEMTDYELTVWLYQQKVVIKKYNVPNYHWEEIKKLWEDSNQNKDE
jgi:hypothetical protein